MGEKKDQLNEIEKDCAKQIVETLRPHFTFNVLNQLKYQIGKNPELAQEMVYDFANFYRASLTLACKEVRTLLDEELRAFKSYLRLECAMNKHMALEMNLSCEKDVRHFVVKPGCLQEFATNLIKEEVRVTKDTRTLLVTDGMKDDQYYIYIKIKETGRELHCPVLAIKGE